jgi:integrase
MRLEASGVLAKARLGMDVVADARVAASKVNVTLGELVPKYLAAREAGDDSFRKLRDKSLVEIVRYLAGSKDKKGKERTPAAWKPLHKLPIDAITRQSVVSVVDDIALESGKTSADRARMALSGLFAWAIERRYVDTNPTLNVRQRAQNKARTRVLSEPELVEVWDACLDDDFGRIVRLLILTGQRRAEIGDLAWSEVDLDKRQIELAEYRTKNHRPHIVPLSDEALALLPEKSEARDLIFGIGAGGFGGWSKAKAELVERIRKARSKAGGKKAMPVWTLHDLRRSFVTHISERGIAQPHIVEAIVNHISGAKAGVAGVYNRASYLSEKRQALELWGAHVRALVTGGTSKVMHLRRGQRAGTGSSGTSAAHTIDGTPV